MNPTATTPPPCHTFEARGLGAAPYEVVDVDVYDDALGECEFCRREIRVYVTLKGSEGRLFTVGHDCAKRHGDRGLLTPHYAARVKAAVAKAKADASHERLVSERERLFGEVVRLAADAKLLAPKPPPVPTYAERNRLAPLAGWVEAALMEEPHVVARAIAATDPELGRRCREAADALTTGDKDAAHAAVRSLYDMQEAAEALPSVLAIAERLRAKGDRLATSAAAIAAADGWSYGWGDLLNPARCQDAALRSRAEAIHNQIREFRRKTEPSYRR